MIVTFTFNKLRSGCRGRYPYKLLTFLDAYPSRGCAVAVHPVGDAAVGLHYRPGGGIGSRNSAARSQAVSCKLEVGVV